MCVRKLQMFLRKLETLHFYHEDGGNRFFRSVSKFLPGYMASDPRRQLFLTRNMGPSSIRQGLSTTQRTLPWSSRSLCRPPAESRSCAAGGVARKSTFYSWEITALKWIAFYISHSKSRHRQHTSSFPSLSSMLEDRRDLQGNLYRHDGNSG
jgi:hypothetical protein